MARWTPPDRRAPIVAAATLEYPRPRRSTSNAPLGTSRQGPREWQSRAWSHYDTCGELRYGVNWFANAVSRADFYLASASTGQRIEEGVEFDALEELFGNGDHKAELLKAFGQHYFVAGEWFLVGRTNEDGEDIWEVVSTEELKRTGIDTQPYTIDYGDGEKVELKASDTVIRMWQPHPRRYQHPDSPVRAVLEILEEIRLLNLHVQAQVRSRIAGAGVMVVPSEMEFPIPKNSPEGTTGAVAFMEELGTAMMEPLSDPGSPAALIPVMLTAPGEYLDKIQHLTFWSDLDEHTVEMRNEAVRRLALGLDLPPEVLTGTADMNHWGAWQVEESTVKAHIEPALGIIADTLTRGYIRAVQQSDPGAEVDTDIVVRYDTAQLRLRPNRSKEAMELYDRGELKPETLLRETGFSEADLPNEEERKQWLLQKIASGSASPEQVEQALNQLGVEIRTAQPGDYTREARPDPSLRDHPRRDPPELPDGLAAACDVHVMRALERAGNRMKSRFGTRPPGSKAHELYRLIQVPSSELSSLLGDCWDHLDRTMARYGYDSDPVKHALDAYVRSLMLTQREHTYEEMQAHLSRALGH